MKGKGQYSIIYGEDNSIEYTIYHTNWENYNTTPC